MVVFAKSAGHNGTLAKTKTAPPIGRAVSYTCGAIMSLTVPIVPLCRQKYSYVMSFDAIREITIVIMSLKLPEPQLCRRPLNLQGAWSKTEDAKCNYVL